MNLDDARQAVAHAPRVEGTAAVPDVAADTVLAAMDRLHLLLEHYRVVGWVGLPEVWTALRGSEG